MNRDNGYYRTLDLRRVAKSVPRDKESRKESAAFQELLIALVLRYEAERFTGSDLLAYLGEPDAIGHNGDGEVWEYSWRGEHCSREYHSSTPFVVKNGHVVGVRQNVLTPAP